MDALQVDVLVNKNAVVTLQCIHGCKDAIVGIFHFENGCICFKDKIQALCLYHYMKADQNVGWDTRITPIITFERLDNENRVQTENRTPRQSSGRKDSPG